MSSTSKTSLSRLRFHQNAYEFVFESLQFTQQNLKRYADVDIDDEAAHISGEELLDGIRQFALKRFGMLTPLVFHQWGVASTDDFGRIVFELIDRGEMRKTDRDHLSDFCDLYDFEQVFDREYEIDTRKAFHK